MKYTDNLIKGLEEMDIQISDIAINQFSLYYDLLIEWNKKINLTAIVEEKEVIVKHFLDSILINKQINFNSINNLIDIGTGAGFPGIPLKIVYPHLNIVLLDSLNKRVNFLNHVCDQLGLENIECLHGRAETYGHNNQYRDSFDLCVSRAVSKLSVLSEYCIPFVKVDGDFIAYKSIHCEDEVENSKEAIEILGGSIESINTFTVPESKINRTFVRISKNYETPKKYPRNPGKPTKNPL